MVRLTFSGATLVATARSWRAVRPSTIAPVQRSQWTASNGQGFVYLGDADGIPIRAIEFWRGDSH